MALPTQISVPKGVQEVLLHNFTSLLPPSRLTTGQTLVQKPVRGLEGTKPFSIILFSPSLEKAEEIASMSSHVAAILWDPEGIWEDRPREWVDLHLPVSPSPGDLDKAFRSAFRLLQFKESCLGLRNECAISEARYDQLRQTGLALVAEKRLDVLLNLILQKAMSLTYSDAGCLYLVETSPDKREVPENYWADKHIRFKLTRNNSVKVEFSESVVPTDKSSIVGYTLLEGRPLLIHDVYTLGEHLEYRHNRGFDAISGYRSRSMLSLPLVDRENRLIGALQLINKAPLKKDPITSEAAADKQVKDFDETDLSVCSALASHASIAILNAQHDREIHDLFEGFIQASVTAIESRDPTTSGHSQRVSEYCTTLARRASEERTGPLGQVFFNDKQIQELRYAALLHDFGKIGVREHILVKSKKLFPAEWEVFKQRIETHRYGIRLQTALRQLELLKKDPHAMSKRDFEELQAIESRRLDGLKEAVELVELANEPIPLSPDLRERLEKLLGENPGTDLTEVSPILKPEEMSRLLTERGSLSLEERTEIEKHVSHTYRFLSKIPWTPELRQVPEIAHAHHEKLDGSGYPGRLHSGSIPLPSQIMAICDIYDALTARDRPYKKAVPVEKALDIIAADVKGGKLNADLFRIFVDSRIYVLDLAE